MADPFGYDPKSEVLETSMLLIYTTDLQKIKTALPVRKAASFSMIKVQLVMIAKPFFHV